MQSNNKNENIIIFVTHSESDGFKVSGGIRVEAGVSDITVESFVLLEGRWWSRYCGGFQGGRLPRQHFVQRLIVVLCVRTAARTACNNKKLLIRHLFGTFLIVLN